MEIVHSISGQKKQVVISLNSTFLSSLHDHVSTNMFEKYLRNLEMLSY